MGGSSARAFTIFPFSQTHELQLSIPITSPLSSKCRHLVVAAAQAEHVRVALVRELRLVAFATMSRSPP